MTLFFVSSVLLVIQFMEVVADTAPKLNPLPFPENLVVGSRARVLCTTYLGDHPLDFQWYKDGKKFSMGKIQQLDASISELTLDPLMREHAGNYTCVAKNDFGTDSVTATLHVKAPPVWVKEPADATVRVGSTLSLDCVAEGMPSVKIVWQRRSPTLGNLVQITSSGRTHIYPNNTLKVNSVEKSDDGLYTCEASNGVGEALHKSVQVSVYDHPVVTAAVERITIQKGQGVTIPCVAKGDGPLSFTWQKNGVPLSDRQDVSRVLFSEDAQMNGIRFSVTIGATLMSDGGMYTCIATNPFGSDRKDIMLYLVEQPHAPEDIEVVDIWSRSARIRWSVPSDGNSPILSYTLEYWSSSGSHHNVSVPGATTSIILRDLVPFTVYRFMIWAVNGYGAGDSSEQQQFMTAKEEPSSPPTDLMVEDKGSTFVQLSWKPPPPEDWNGNILGYYVGYRQSSSTLPYTYNTVESTEDSVYYALRGLKKGTRYVIVVKAFNDVGTGPESQEISVRTHNHEPPPRPSLLVKSIGSTHIQLYWPLTDEMKSVTKSYSLNYRKESSKWQEIVIPDAMQNTFTLTNLDPGVTYQIYLTAQTNLGISEPSDTATVHTMAEPLYHPEAPHSPPLQSGVDDFTQTLYVVVPIAVSTVIIVTVIVVACVYVYSKRPVSVPNHYADLPPDKNFTYMSTMPRHHNIPATICGRNTMKQGSPMSTAPLTRHEPEEEEPIYESVMDEIRCKMKQRAFDEDNTIGSGTIV